MVEFAGLLDVWGLMISVFGNNLIAIFVSALIFWIICMFSRTMSDNTKIWIVGYYLALMLMSSYVIFTAAFVIFSFAYFISGIMALIRKAQ